MIKIEFDYGIGERVKIKDLNIVGTIIALLYCESGTQFQVSYVHEGSFKREYLYPFELEPVGKINYKSAMGFRGIDA